MLDSVSLAFLYSCSNVSLNILSEFLNRSLVYIALFFFVSSFTSFLLSFISSSVISGFAFLLIISLVHSSSISFNPSVSDLARAFTDFIIVVLLSFSLRGHFNLSFTCHSIMIPSHDIASSYFVLLSSDHPSVNPIMSHITSASPDRKSIVASNSDSMNDPTHGSSIVPWNMIHPCVNDIIDANARFTESNITSAFLSIRSSVPTGFIAAILLSKFSSSMLYATPASVSRYLFTTPLCTSSCGISFPFLS